MAGSIPASATSERPASCRATPSVLGWRSGSRSCCRGSGRLCSRGSSCRRRPRRRIAPSDTFGSVWGRFAAICLHLMGTDDLGRDLLAGVVHGARTSLLVVRRSPCWPRSWASPSGARGIPPGRVDDLLMRHRVRPGRSEFLPGGRRHRPLWSGAQPPGPVLGLTRGRCSPASSGLRSVLRTATSSSRSRARGPATRIVMRQILPNGVPPPSWCSP